MAILASVVLVAPAVALADGRVALVVGNSTYTHIGRLPNPDNDARDIIGGAASTRARGDQRVRHRPGGTDRCVAGVHTRRGCRHRSTVESLVTQW